MQLFSKRVLTHPKDNELEITIFGPGYGESIVLHIPEVGWGIIDSCTFTINKTSIVPPLEYLLSLLSPDFPKLAFVILTHPHEDHYLGLDKILKEYPAGIERVCRYAGQGSRELLTYMTQQKIAEREVLPGLVQVFNAFKEAEKAGAIFRQLGEMTTIFRKENANINGYGNTDIHMMALSPSGASSQKYAEMLYASYPKTGEIPPILNDRAHNMISVALLLTIGNIKIIFGSDVEDGEEDNIGWKGIITNKDCPILSADFVKVAHHGSENGFNKHVWEKHGEIKKPLAVITPFNRSSLPKEEDVTRIKQVAKPVGITKIVKPPKRLTDYYARDIATAVNSGTRSITIISPENQIGIVRVRLSINGQITERIAEQPAGWV